MSETVSFFFSPEWPVLYLDNHLLALYKPAGLLVQGDKTADVSLLELGKLWLKKQYGKPGRVFLGMVHRLDRPVAGVVLFCRTSKAAGRISEQIRSGSVAKTYLAVVEGRPPEGRGRLTNFIETGVKHNRIVSQSNSRSRIATLSYRLVDTDKSLSLLEIRLETGRKHQIRLQLANIGHPLLGDKRYGASSALPQRQIALFARSLRIMHPTRKVQMAIQAPLPKGWPWAAEQAVANAPPWNWDELRPQIYSCLPLVHSTGL
ncbi:RluA family pseudouridine synthase [Desulfoferrobacter suflitae]|uniref:RluA family pseudouridine synthase n=1 Tax=Desulfoferrobacter suflitae TaxID=2865782 RepID=UPI002164BA71|nr:RNA pseudouridine synthase [Desulfoferrobacter suflitae]MCK8601516.1 RNA pseudouridine synthase [Desulfoferrobacter suflitae]